MRLQILIPGVKSSLWKSSASSRCSDVYTQIQMSKKYRKIQMIQKYKSRFLLSYETSIPLIQEPDISVRNLCKIHMVLILLFTVPLRTAPLHTLPSHPSVVPKSKLQCKSLNLKSPHTNSNANLKILQSDTDSDATGFQLKQE